MRLLLSSLMHCLTDCFSANCCRKIHARVAKSFSFSDGFIGDRLVSLYVRLNCDYDARKLFDEMPDKDLVSWNSLISGFSRRGDFDKCLGLFCRLRLNVRFKANEVSFLSVISGCSDAVAINEGKYVHGLVLRIGFLSECKVVNSLVNMYGKFRDLEAAYVLFEEASLVCNLVSWNSIIEVHVQNGCAEKAMCLFKMMKRAGLNPDQGTFVSLLKACAELGVRKQAKAIHGCAFVSGLDSDVTIETALLNLYAKLGQLNASIKVFRAIKCLDRIAWTAMLAGYAMHGCGRDAIKHFELMVVEGVSPDHVTFTHLLSACSHSGLVDEGKKYFEIMSNVFSVEPKLDHYSCMVDLLGRSGLLKDAYEMIKSMPMEPNCGVWGALLGACRVYKDIDIAKKAAERLIALDPLDPRNYVMLSNIYSASGLWNEASKTRALMKGRGVTSTPGCSFIEHGNKIHRFVVGDRSHPDSHKIHSKLQELIKKIREAGFSAKTEYVLHDVDEEVKEDMVNQHSEKLAMAFGLLVTKAGQPLIITKNLRICGDCHKTAKAISLIEKRLLTIRDSKRFHHFADGLCSCNDYWQLSVRMSIERSTVMEDSMNCSDDESDNPVDMSRCERITQEEQRASSNPLDVLSALAAYIGHREIPVVSMPSSHNDKPSCVPDHDNPSNIDVLLRESNLKKPVVYNDHQETTDLSFSFLTLTPECRRRRSSPHDHYHADASDHEPSTSKRRLLSKKDQDHMLKQKSRGQKKKTCGTKKNKKGLEEDIPPRDLPGLCREAIDRLGGTNIKLVIQKELTPTDVTRGQSRLLMPVKQVINHDFLTEEEIKRFDDDKDAEICIMEMLDTKYNPVSGMKLKRWAMSSNHNYVLTKQWNNLVLTNNLEAMVYEMIQIWSFRINDNNDLCLAIVLIDEDEEAGNNEVADADELEEAGDNEGADADIDAATNMDQQHI